MLPIIALILFTTPASAEKKKQGGGPPPMLVSAEKIISGKAEPTAAFVGTVYFSRTAEVAAEVEGIVKKVYINDGQSIKAGEQLIRLSDDLLETEILGTRALYEQNQIDVLQAEKDYKRISTLHNQDSIATSEYEAYDARLSRLQKQSTVLKARLDRLLLEQKKKTVHAPFDGLVIESLVEAGEWVAAGGKVAAVADNRNLEVHVDIPATLINFLTRDREVRVSTAGEGLSATFLTLIPKGDFATRTFTAKFRIKGKPKLIEGMQATVMLPTATAVNGLLVPRDAVVKQFGRDIIFLVVEGSAKMVHVQIMGYQGMQVAVSGEGIEEGQLVVTKGNERIRDGHPVRF
jgi:RND family efflux transporter MFP subunit